MAFTGRKMSGQQRREWAKEYDRRKAAGAHVRRRGRMELIEDDQGNWFKRNGDACCGCGRDQQAGHHGDYGKPPRWGKR